jgi:hypothetical protein
MDGKRLAKILPVMVGIGFCVVEALKLVFLMDSATAPDAATGHTQPSLFAPEISTSWRYITDTQIGILTVTTIAVLVLAVVMFALQWRHRAAGTGGSKAGPSAEPRTSRAPQASSKHVTFGRARGRANGPGQI